MANPILFKLPSQPSEPPLLRLEPFQGMNVSVTPTQINQSQSPDMLNMTLDERGALNKRTGYERVFQTSLGSGPILGLYEYVKVSDEAHFLIAHGTSLYTQSGSDQPVQIYSGMSGQRVEFFAFNDKCYILDGQHYLVYDGSTIQDVQPYIPTLSIARTPDGSNTSNSVNEDINLLGAGFKDSFSGNGSATAFKMSQDGLDGTAVTAVVDNANKVEGTDFTVDRGSGTVTFTTAPSNGTDNVIITAYKTHAGLPERIKSCRFHVIFGGAQDTRVFLSGNPNMWEYIWRSGLNDPTYWPENGFYKFNGKIKGFCIQYDTLIVHRENGAHQIQFQLDSNGNPSFPSKPINDEIGTLSENSIQLLDNTPVFLSKNGVYQLVSSSVRDERNMQHISDNIDKKLLTESGLEGTVSIDYDHKYWLAINGNVYIYDYTIKQWFLYSSIKANCFIELNRQLYFGCSDDGMIYRFKKTTDLYPYSDDGQPITAYWKSKVLSFSADERKKLVQKVFFSLSPYIRTSCDLYFLSDKQTRKFVKRTRKDLFHYSYFDYSVFSYATNEFPQESANKIKAKKIFYFQIELRNEQLDEPCTILSASIKFLYQALAK